MNLTVHEITLETNQPHCSSVFNTSTNHIIDNTKAGSEATVPFLGKALNSVKDPPTQTQENQNPLQITSYFPPLQKKKKISRGNRGGFKKKERKERK